MGHRLHIKYDGDVAGLSEHRLSLSQFGSALSELVKVVRRSISNRLVNADRDTHGAQGGRLARLAESVDLHVESIDDGSVELALDVEVTGQLDMLALESGLSDFVDGVERASTGSESNSIFGRYLAALPTGLAAHSYRAAAGDRVFAAASLGPVTATSAEDEAAQGPLLIEVEARVRGVDFQPPRVRLQTDLGRLSLKASGDLVARALALRDETTRVRYLPSVQRLLAIRGTDDERKAGSFESAVDDVFDRWAELLDRLSR